MEIVLQKELISKDENGFYIELKTDVIEDDCDSLEDASMMVRDFIEHSTFVYTGGYVYEDGVQIAYISQNGRVWLPESKRYESELI